VLSSSPGEGLGMRLVFFNFNIKPCVNMNSVIDFIKEFKFSGYGFVMFGLMLVALLLLNWIASFFPVHIGSRIKSIGTILFTTISYGVIALIVLNALFTHNYIKLWFLIFAVLIPYIRQWADKLYQVYDNLVDRIMNNK
jgi:hypothetical protein